MDFSAAVLAFIKRVPPGKVVSYGQVAATCGKPRAAREVGRILKSLDVSASFTQGPQISSTANYLGNLGKGARFRKPELTKFFLSAEAEGTTVPWWRVLNNQGVISIKGNWTATKELQQKLLRKEGIVIGEDFKLDMEKYRYKN